MDGAAQKVEELAEAAGKKVQWPKWALAIALSRQWSRVWNLGDPCAGI